jgi:hypothetical protein
MITWSGAFARRPRRRTRNQCVRVTPEVGDNRIQHHERTSRSQTRDRLHGSFGLTCYLREKGSAMAAMKPRTGDGPLEVTKEGRGIVMRVPLEGGGRLVVELTPDEARDLGAQLSTVAV